jgi:hypothetical protein
VFTGGSATQTVKFWDVRARKPVYELLTGNNIVNSLAWNAPNATMSEYTAWRGSRQGYRRARKACREDGADKARDTDENELEYDNVLR